MGTVSLAVISVNTTFYICKDLITNERYTLCRRLCITLRRILLPCILYAFMYCICESNSVELQINLFIIIILLLFANDCQLGSAFSSVPYIEENFADVG